ncbi:hypothetical protein V490_09457 [Pseudogymnoascus sp. VKM F-3557]|nr:hypothetical protein V490_09457 [Pseudogymnoascus sp. VKM F-3557]
MMLHPIITRQGTRFYQPLRKHFSSAASDKTPIKHVIITGASGGIGRAIASRFALEGARCTLIGRTESKLQASLKGLSAQEDHHQVVVGDVGKEAFWKDLAKKLKEEKSQCDVLVNAAGITHYSLLVRTPAAKVDEVLDTNLRGTILGCQYMAKDMMRKKTGCIINIASLLGVKGGRGSSVYAASKAAVLGFTRALAAETGPSGVRVNTVVPGYIETEMVSGMEPALFESTKNAIPLQRFGTAEEVADAAFFLAANQYANNCTLNLDGGLSAV